MNNLEIIKNELDEVETIPLRERTIFQIKLMEKMLGPDFANKSPQEKTNAELEWADNYAKLVSDVIDHTQYKTIRDLIMSGEYEKAVEQILPVIDHILIDNKKQVA